MQFSKWQRYIPPVIKLLKKRYYLQGDIVIRIITKVVIFREFISLLTKESASSYVSLCLIQLQKLFYIGKNVLNSSRIHLLHFYNSIGESRFRMFRYNEYVDALSTLVFPIINSSLIMIYREKWYFFTLIVPYYTQLSHYSKCQVNPLKQ